MLLIDQVKYQEYIPKNEDELERMVNEHALEIFGENSLYFDRKLKLQSLSGVGSIPDGYAIVFSDIYQWHIVEVELSSHQLYNHIVPQVSRFINGIKNPSTQKVIIDAMYHALIADNIKYHRMDKEIQSGEIYKFISDLVSKPPEITIIIEKDTSELHEALASLNHPKKNIVEFQTFVREGVGLPVHAHLFEPLCEGEKRDSRGYKGQEGTGKDKKERKKAGAKGGRVTFAELVKAGLLQDEQVLYFYNTRPFMDERAKVIVSSDKLQYERDEHPYSKSELAGILLEKHGFKHGDYPVQGPKFWKTEDGSLLDDLNEEIRIQRGERGGAIKELSLG